MLIARHRLYCLLVMVAFSQTTASPSPSTASPESRAFSISWRESLPAPPSVHGAGAFSGESNGVLIVAGGVRKDNAAEFFTKQIHVLKLDAPDPQWIQAGQLPESMANGASASLDGKLVCIGGRNERGILNSTRILQWDADASIVKISSGPAFPWPIYQATAAVFRDRIYIIGGRDQEDQARSEFKSLNLFGPNSWENHARWDGPGRFGASAAVQRGGESDYLYIMGGNDGKHVLKDVHRYDPVLDSWTEVAELPEPRFLAPSLPVGQAHIALISGLTTPQKGDLLSIGYAEESYLYHTITDTWTIIESPATPVADGGAIARGNGLLLTAGSSASPSFGTRLFEGKFEAPLKHFSSWDFLVLVVYLAVLITIGIGCTRRKSTSREFFLAGQRIPFWAAGLSLMATQVSAIGFMAVPAKTYATNWFYFVGVLTWFIVVPIVNAAFIPFFRRLNVTSAYEYLECRFNLAARLFAGLIFSLLQLGRMAVVLYLPALALASVTDLPLTWSIIVMGILATTYTVAGGMAAVIWTDVIQAIVLLGGAFLCICWVVFSIDGGVLGFMEIASEYDKFALADWSWDFTTAAIWVVLLGNLFQRLSVLTSDQSIIQRYMSTPTEIQSRRALWTDALVSIPWALLVFLLGTALFVFYHEHPDALPPQVNTDAVVPLFISQQLPVGVTGLVIAAIFAAAMSSLDSAIHSTSTIWVNDFVNRLHPNMEDRVRLLFARGFVIFLGVFGTATALWMASTNIQSLWDFFMAFVGLLLGGLCGLFLLGIFSRRANAWGSLIGAASSAIITLLIRNQTEIHFFLYPVIGIVSCYLLGYIFSRCLPSVLPPPGLTYGDTRPYTPQDDTP